MMNKEKNPNHSYWEKQTHKTGSLSGGPGLLSSYPEDFCPVRRDPNRQAVKNTRCV